MKLLHNIFGKYISFMTKNELKSTVYDLELFQKILLMLYIVNIASIRDRPTRRFWSVRPYRSDNPWVRSVLVKDRRTPGGSVAL